MTISAVPDTTKEGVLVGRTKKCKRLDRRIVRTREALLQAGSALFAERGLYEVSIDDIIERASISKQTFYNHFNDKFSLAKVIYRNMRGEIELEVDKINAEIQDPALRIARGICVYTRRSMQGRDQARFLTQMLNQDIELEIPANYGLLKDLEAGLAAGQFIVRTLHLSAAFILGAAEPMLAHVAGNNDPTNVIGVVQEFLTMIFRALAMPPMEAERIAAQAANQVIGLGSEAPNGRPRIG